MNRSDRTNPSEEPEAPKTPVERLLDSIERIGNALPDPAVLFLIALALTWGISWWLSGVAFTEVRPGTDQPVEVRNLLSGPSLAGFLANMVKAFREFPPLGVVLVAMLGVGVAEASGMIHVALKELLRLTPATLLTPMLLLVAIISHTAADAGYLLVIPIGGVLFYAAGRHPLAGIACAFAGVSGGFSANFIPSGIDPMLAAITETGVKVIAEDRSVNPLCNIFFTAASSLVVIAVGWYLTDRVVEPRLAGTAFTDGKSGAGGDGDPQAAAAGGEVDEPTLRDRLGLLAALVAILLGVVALVLWSRPDESPLRGPDQSLVHPQAPLMQGIVPLIFLFFLIPGIIHGYVSGRFKNHRDVVAGMTQAMSSMSYYLVLVFFAALFITSFTESNLGLLLAVKGADWLASLQAPAAVTVVGLILLTAFVNLFIGSASAKWALLAPIFVPMLMLRGISPELTQAGYRVGDSTSNIVTPMMPYFPLVVVYCRRYVAAAGVGTVGSMMLPYSIVLLLLWTVFLLGYWALGIPLGFDAPYTEPLSTP